MIAGVLGAALAGMESRAEPPPPVTGNAYDQGLPQLPASWAEAITRFETSPHVADCFAPGLIRNLVQTKRQELRYMAELGPEERLELYLDTV